MKISIISINNQVTGEKKLPAQFREPMRKDLIKRAVHASQANRRQPYGAYERAGQNFSGTLSKRRRKYRGSYGKGIARVTRKIMSRKGLRLNWTAAIAPGTVGGRRAFPPQVNKDWSKKINNKERRKAIRSALAATVNKEAVQERGHKLPTNYPLAIETKFEEENKTKNIKETLKKIGLTNELLRAEIKKVRPGKGTMRNRKYKTKKGPLIIVSKNCKLLKAAKNIPGIDIIIVHKINTELLAPGAHPGRLTLFTEAAIQKIEEEKLFM
jgi:large subunit ribosomal protein L4e